MLATHHPSQAPTNLFWQGHMHHKQSQFIKYRFAVFSKSLNPSNNYLDNTHINHGYKVKTFIYTCNLS